VELHQDHSYRCLGDILNPPCKMKTPLCKRLPDNKIRKVVVELDDFIGRYRLHESEGEFFLADNDLQRKTHTKSTINASEWVDVKSTKKRDKQQQSKRVVKKLIKNMINDGYVLDQNDIKPPNLFN